MPSSDLHSLTNPLENIIQQMSFWGVVLDDEQLLSQQGSHDGGASSSSSFIHDDGNNSDTFTRPVLLKTHMNEHLDIRPFACSHCPERFFRKYDMTRHESSKHLIDRIACELCGITFSRPDALKRHERVCVVAAAAKNGRRAVSE
ncbi:hypothetical protein HK100_006040 [Physocladia obscura]|uniref:C2H2-type domain-containing protein n=1 Tax=Physocladia obscura TaxID=109957 RepID=A0AAD5T622_9FUNG|nr:hypothetical protein HK100_006040 [Physocladia obscura]